MFSPVSENHKIYNVVMIISKAHARIGTHQFSACIIKSVYNGEYSTNDVISSSGYMGSRSEAQDWALKDLKLHKPLLRLVVDADDRHPEIEFWIELSEWVWVDVSSPGILDSEITELNRQYGYPDDSSEVEWLSPEKV